jgi:acylphosphatase
MSVKSVRVVIQGRVQGVWFRGWTLQQAQQRNISGWVRNRRDGTVEALFSGPAEEVDKMINACRIGPPVARVESLTQYPSDPPEDEGFHSLATV